MAKISAKDAEVTTYQESFGIIKYSYHGDGNHFKDSRKASVIGIPNKKYTHGRQVFKNLKAGQRLSLIAYDSARKNIVGIFEAVGPCFIDDEKAFAKDKRKPKERWSLRLRGMPLIDSKHAIPIKKFTKKFPDRKIVRGAYQGVTRKEYDFIKQHFMTIQ